MSDAAYRKPHPLAMRLPAADLALIDQAAKKRGRSRTDFVREAAVRAAEEVIMEDAGVRLSPEAFAHFMAIISGPAQPCPKLEEVMRRQPPWEQDAEQG